MNKKLARISAKKFAEELQNVFYPTKELNDLLNTPVIEWDENKHLKITFFYREWLNGGEPLTICFSLETGDPIYAYFKESDDISSVEDSTLTYDELMEAIIEAYLIYGPKVPKPNTHDVYIDRKLIEYTTDKVWALVNLKDSIKCDDISSVD